MLVGRLLVQDCVSSDILEFIGPSEGFVITHQRNMGLGIPCCSTLCSSTIRDVFRKNKGKYKVTAQGPYQLMHLKP